MVPNATILQLYSQILVSGQMQLYCILCNYIATYSTICNYMQHMQLYFKYMQLYATYATICNYIATKCNYIATISYETICKYATICNNATCNMQLMKLCKMQHATYATMKL